MSRFRDWCVPTLAAYLAVVGWSAYATADGSADPGIQDCISIAAYDLNNVGQVPHGWEARDRRDREFVRDALPYVVATDQDRGVIQAEYKDHTVTIGKPTPEWDVERYPILRWDWKVVVLPEGADETSGDRNDTAAAVYVIWDEPFPFFLSGIKYSWSTTLPVGTKYSKRFGYDVLRVVGSGPEGLGEWSTVSVHVKEDYWEEFSEEIRQPWGIALMTDADRSPNGAEAYFGPIWGCSE